MDINTVLQSKECKVLVWSLAGLIVVFAIFEAGVIVGIKNGEYAYRWQKHYEQNFGGPRGRVPFDGQRPSPMQGLRHIAGSTMMAAHGISGTILKIDGQTIVMQGRDEVEKIIQLGTLSLIKRLRDTIQVSDLKVGDTIVVIGNPNDAGQVDAKFIRVMPPVTFQKVH